MGFQPIITLTNVPRDNSGFTVVDATPTGGTTGWGSPGAPTGPSSITSLFGQVQPYGEQALNTLGVSGSVATTMNFQVQILDGVNNYIVYYGLIQTFTDFTTSADGLSAISNDPNLLNLMAGVTALSLDGVTFPVSIISVVGNLIIFGSPVPANQTGNSPYIYYSASTQALTLNNGEAICVNGMSVLPIQTEPNPNAQGILDNVLLKLASEIAFNCGNISKAHEAARLLSGLKPFVTNQCNTCG